VPRAVDPTDEGTATALHVQIAPEPPADGAATFILHSIVAEDLYSTPIWRITAPGDRFDAPLWDLPALDPTLPAIPDGPTDKLMWTTYLITVPGLSWDDWTYRYKNASYWSAYSKARYEVSFP
jgi:hypothetical protein